MLIRRELFNNSKAKYWKVNCFPNTVQEPYVTLKMNIHTPLFDESFINYGGDKIQYIRHLRYLSLFSYS